MFHLLTLTLSWRSLWTDKQQRGVTEGANYELTHGPEELLVQFKGHERVGKVAKPLFENAGNDVDVVVIQVHAVHIWNREKGSGKATFFHLEVGEEEVVVATEVVEEEEEEEAVADAAVEEDQEEEEVIIVVVEVVI